MYSADIFRKYINDIYTVLLLTCSKLSGTGSITTTSPLQRDGYISEVQHAPQTRTQYLTCTAPTARHHCTAAATTTISTQTSAITSTSGGRCVREHYCAVPVRQRLELQSELTEQGAQ